MRAYLTPLNRTAACWGFGGCEYYLAVLPVGRTAGRAFNGAAMAWRAMRCITSRLLPGCFLAASWLLFAGFPAFLAAA